jgi:hypothetical protein
MVLHKIREDVVEGKGVPAPNLTAVGFERKT